MIKKRLFELQDEAYGDLLSKLTPTIERERVIGVRTPALRALARELDGTNEAAEFLAELPHYYYDENNLHAFLIMRIKSFDAALFEVERFLPHVDNWATCDSLAPKAFAKTPEPLLPAIERWLASDRVYTARFGIGCLMRYFLGERFRSEYADAVAAIRSDEYYVQMMAAWYFATALAKNRDEAWGYVARLDPTVRKMAIRKAIESYRISDEDKDRLRRINAECQNAECKMNGKRHAERN